MYLASDRFVNSIGASHTAVRYAEVVDGDDVLYTFMVVDGSARANGRDAIRRDATLTVVDPYEQLAPKDIGDLLMPFGTEFRLRSGIRFKDGSEETIPWGVYRLDSVSISEGQEGLAISINGYDRAFMVQQPSSKPVVIKAGTKYEEAVFKLVASRMNLVDRSLMDTGYVTPSLFFKASLDLWAEAQKMAKSVGCQVYFDSNGVLTVSSVVAQMDASLVQRYSADDSNIVGITRTIQADGLPNGVVVIGESSSIAGSVRGEAWDLNPRSPTYRYGTYGEVVRSETSEFVITDAQARASAQGILEEELGPYETIEIQAPANPLQDIGDIIYARREKAGIDGYYIVTDLVYPWNVTDAMTITARKKIVDA